MPYITREDGQHFVIPSYREIIFAKQKASLKKEVMALSHNYGEYVTINRKGPSQYEVAFSPDAGYSLGETVWHHFGRPGDMIYCEAIPDTSEAILVIVKDGSVYLDGSFPVESIPEELVIFLTQQNNFDIYIYGNVPISQTPEDGKFCFEESSVNSFTTLEEPVFNKLPLLKAYQFQLVEIALRAQGVGAFPFMQFVLILAGVAGAWMIIKLTIFSEPPPPPVEVMEVNPYEAYVKEMKSPDPVEVMQFLANSYNLFNSIVGWHPVKVNYLSTNVTAELKSDGNSVEFLMDWAKMNDANVTMTTRGINLTVGKQFINRPYNRKIYSMTEIVALFLDRIQQVLPGNSVSLKFADSKKVKHRIAYLTINLKNSTPGLLNIIAEQLKDLPLIADKAEIRISDETLNGSITFKALGT